jgi:hypothetical protein
MKRLRHVVFAAEQRKEHIREDEPQVRPIYDAIAQALRDCDILRIVKYHDFAYETDVLWLLHHLPATSHCNDVADLLKERFGGQQGSTQLDPEDVLRMHALAEDMWRAWSQYLHRHDQSAFAHARSRARGLMGRHYYPRTNNR